MDFIQNMILPDSSGNISLLHYLLASVSVIFVTYSGLLTGSTFFSIIHYFQSRKGTRKEFGTVSKSFVSSGNKGFYYSLGLGIIPLISIILILAQLLPHNKHYVMAYFGMALILYSAASVILYLYKQSQNFKNGPKVNFGVMSLLMIAVAMYLFIIGMNKIIGADYIANLINFGQFISASVIISVIVYFMDNEMGKGEGALSRVQEKLLQYAFLSTFTQPVFFVAGMVMLPAKTISLLSTLSIAFGIISSFAVGIFLYEYIRERKVVYTKATFSLILLMFTFFVFKDLTAFSVSNKLHEIVMEKEYGEFLAEMKPVKHVTEEEVSGEMLYKQRCMACHAFDKKMVGPAHKDVLPKYIDNKEGLVDFILNPEKIDPAFPPMANLGLRKNEARAVADYLMQLYDEEMKK